MPSPYKQDLTISSGQTTSSTGAYVADVDVRAIQIPDSFTGATISFTGAAITKRTGTNAEPSTYTQIVDSTGSAVTVTATDGKIVVLTEAQRDAIAAAHWIKLVSASSEGADRTVSLIGVSRYR